MMELETTPETPTRPHLVRMASNCHRILIYTTVYNVLDGVTLTVRKLEREILAAGHHVCILTTKSGDPSNTNLDGEHPNRQVLFLDNAIPIPFLHDPKNPEKSYQLGFSLSRTVKRAISEFEPSLIHITAPDCTCLHLIQYARDKEIPLMGTYHSNIPEYMDHYPGLGWLKHILGAFFRHQYSFLQSLYVPTPFIQKHLEDSWELDKVTTLGIWGRGIDLERFSPSHRSLKFRKDLGIDDDEVIVCWVGRIVIEKRPDIFAQVIRRLAERHVRFRALVIGTGPYEEELASLPNTTFMGWMSGEELSTVYASSDVFLFPSAVETFGNVTLEAAASGLPVIVDAGCSGHLIQDGANGYAIVGEDVGAYFDATYRLVTDHNLRKRMSRASREVSLPLEQRKVVREMLENYAYVTDEFFVDYGGHHENRDMSRNIEGSFPAGNYPRPFMMQIAEYLFIVLFQIMWYASSVVFCLHRYVMSFMFTPISSSAPTSPIVRASPAAAKVNKRNDIEIQDIEDSGDDEMQELLLEDDEETAVTESSSVRSSPSDCFARCNIASTLAILFVQVFSAQCRMESYLRDSLTVCCWQKRWRERKRKRKNSNYGKSRCPSGESDGSESSSLSSRGDEELGRRVRSSPALDEELGCRVRSTPVEVI